VGKLNSLVFKLIRFVYDLIVSLCSTYSFIHVSRIIEVIKHSCVYFWHIFNAEVSSGHFCSVTGK